MKAQGKKKKEKKAGTKTISLPKIRVFIVDDHPIVRYGITRIINEEPDLTVCGEASGSLDLMDKIASERPDVILLDISLDGALDGLKITKMLHSRFPNISVLILSMHDENTYAQKAVRSGAKGYIMKDESYDMLPEAIRTVMKKEIYLSNEVKETLLKSLISPPEETKTVVEQLSDRERQVFNFLGAGYTSKAIAAKLGVSIKTIETHRSRIKTKLGIKNTPSLLLAAVSWADLDGISPPPN